jgi:hypothetical protein
MQALVWPTDDIQRVWDDMLNRAKELRDRKQADSAQASRPPA